MDTLDILTVRVESARIHGEMTDYVRDVSGCIAIIRGLEREIATYKGCVSAARDEMSRLEQMARWKDDAESKARDRELMLVGARRITDAFDTELTRVAA